MTDYYQDKKEEEVNKILRKQLGKLGMTLRSGKIPGYRIISRSKHNMLIQLQMKPKKLEQVGEVLKSELGEHWIQCIYNCYD